MKKEWNGWTILEKNKNGTKTPCCAVFDSKGCIEGLSGYIYVYYGKQQAVDDAKGLNKVWHDDRAFSVQKCKVVLL